MPTSNTCYQIRAGRTRTTAIPAAGLPLPVSRQPEYRAPIPFAGDEHPDWISHTLPQPTEIATRLTPWATWFCAPSIPTPEDWVTYGGMAYKKQTAVWLLSCQSTLVAVQLAFHEAMHLAEDFLTLSEMQTLNAGLVSTLDLSPGRLSRLLRRRRRGAGKQFRGTPEADPR